MVSIEIPNKKQIIEISKAEFNKEVRLFYSELAILRKQIAILIDEVAIINKKLDMQV